MQISLTLVLGLLLSFTSSKSDYCEDYIVHFDGCKCDKEASDPELYGKRSFLVTCGSLPEVMSINQMGHDSEQEIIYSDDESIAKYVQPLKDHLVKNNELIEIKQRCMRGSIQSMVESSRFNLDKYQVSRLIRTLIDIMKVFLDKNMILTNLNPAQICLDDKDQPTLYDLRGFKGRKEKYLVDSLPQFLPPEYFQSYIEDSQFVFDEKFLSYQVGYLFYFMIKRKHPFRLRDAKDENIWTKKIEFDQVDRANFVSFIQRTLVNHHIRASMNEVSANFVKDENEHYFNFGVSTLNRDEYYVLEENVLHEKEKVSNKTSFTKVVLMILGFLGLLMLGTYVFCRDTFYIFMPKNDLEQDMHSENSGEYSISVEADKDPKETPST